MKLVATTFCKLRGAFPFACVSEVCRHRFHVILVARRLGLFLRLHFNPYCLVDISSLSNCYKVNKIPSHFVLDFVKVLYCLVFVVPSHDVRILVKIHHAKVL